MRYGNRLYKSAWSWAKCLVLFVCYGVFFAELTAADQVVDWPTLSSTLVVTLGFPSPVAIAHAGDNSQRLFVVEQPGRIWIVQSNSLLSRPFLEISNRVAAGGERGLLGLAFSPGFSTNHHFYANYTRQPDGAIVISRFFVTATNANVADAHSEQILLVIAKPYDNHNGGQLAFGPDGYLYIGVGDGGSEGDPLNNGQSTTNLLGKILRIDVENGVSPYAIPADNPFVGQAGYLPEIWAYGLRNPWRFSFDRLTGDLYIGDVGQDRYEEIDFQPAGSAGGQNYGWKIMEGTNTYKVPAGFTNFSRLTPPVAVYTHSLWESAVIGGYVYRGPSVPRMNGMYFYGDFQAGWIWTLKQVGTNWQNVPLGTSVYHEISALGEDDQGNLYWADYPFGRIYQIQDSLQTWAPTFSATNSVIFSNLVTVACLTLNADIHYTTNGIDPTQADPLVPAGGTIVVSTGVTNKLRAFRADLSPSAVTSAVFTNKVALPSFSPAPGPVTNGTVVTISTITPGATLFVTTNGTSPTTNSPVYAEPVTISRATTFQVLGVENGYSNSAVLSGTYSLARVASPVFNPPAGAFPAGVAVVTNGTPVSISCATSASKIYYTLDGTTPTTNSPVYSGPFNLSGQTRVSAMAVAAGYVSSPVQSVLYQLAQTATPVFDPPAGPLTNGARLVISCATTGAVIHLTLDGTPPTSNSPVYTGALVFDGHNGGVTLNAVGSAAGYQDSAVASVFYGLFSPEKTVVTTFAGRPAAGFTNGLGARAMFSGPQGICIDQAGNLYVADTGNSVIRQISPAGMVTTLAGTGVPGSQVGTATNAQFDQPSGVCVDTAGNLYVADGINCNRVCLLDTNGTVGVLAEIYGDCNQSPDLWQLMADRAGNVYVGSSASVQKIDAHGTVIGLAGPHTCCLDGWGQSVGPGIDSATNIYAATGVLIWKITPDGTTTLFAGGTEGFSDGPLAAARFQAPLDAWVDGWTNVYVTDAGWIRKIGFTGWVSTLAGDGTSGYKNGPGPLAQFNTPTALCADTNGNIFVADSRNNCIREISPDTAGIGIADEWQRAHFGSIGIDPNADPDGDGMSNYKEFWAGTDPLDPHSVLALDCALLSGNGAVQIQWPTVPGKTYVLLYSTDLETWTIWGDSILGDGSMATMTDTSASQQNQPHYYRVVITGF